MARNSYLGGAKRQSNFEALRLLSMLMVLNLHSFWGYDHNHGSILFQAIDFFRNSTSICAVNAFVLISGYFGIKWKPKSFFNLVFQVLFYSFSVYLFVVFLGIMPFEKSEFLSCFKGLYSPWGFVKNYLLLYFFSPMLNSFCDSLSNRRLLVFMLVFYMAEVSIFIYNELMNFCFLYMLARLIRKTDTLTKLKCGVSKAYWLTTFIIFILSFVLFIVFNFKALVMTRLFLAYSYASPFVIMQAVLLFFIFGKMSFSSKIVNWCSSSVLAIFLIHTHPAIKQIGYYSFTESLYERPVLEHILCLLLLMLIVFLGSILVDKVRIVISDSCYKTLEYVYNKIPKKLVTFETYLPKKFLELV